MCVVGYLLDLNFNCDDAGAGINLLVLFVGVCLPTPCLHEGICWQVNGLSACDCIKGWKVGHQKVVVVAECG